MNSTLHITPQPFINQIQAIAYTATSLKGQTFRQTNQTKYLARLTEKSRVSKPRESWLPFNPHRDCN